MNSLAHKSPIVEGIVLNIISKYDLEHKKERHVLNVDLVPKLHEKVYEKKQMQESISVQPPVQQTQQISSATNQQIDMRPRVLQVQTLVRKQENISAEEIYKRISVFLRDPFVSHVECKGPNTQLFVIKNGRPQATQMILTREQIDEFLIFISEKTRIPLYQGVFRATFEGSTINAVLSNSLDPTFIIKKNQELI